MRSRLVPAALFATAAALYWLAAFPVIRLALYDAPDSSCGGECGINVTFGDVAGPLVASVIAAAVAGWVLGPRLAAWFGTERRRAFEAGAVITTVAYVLSYLGYAVWLALASGYRPLISGEQLLGVSTVLLPFLFTAFPFGLAASYVWWRSTLARPPGP